jgi:spectinomycin phosphotransferase
MLEKPPVADERIVACLRAHYRVEVANLEFLPVGYDHTAWVYRVTATGGQRYFLKLRRGAASAGGAAVADYLKEHGIPEVVAPLTTSTGQLFAPLEDYTLLLYPWIEGRTGARAEGGLSAAQWVAYGALVERIHATRLPEALATAIPTEDFVLRHNWGDFVRQFSQTILRSAYQNPHKRKFAALWHAHADEIIGVVEQAEAIGHLLRRQHVEFVLCHADIHTANLLVTPDGSLFIIDWDQPMLAPKECDLMFIVTADTQPSREETLFVVGYGAVEVDALALAYYRFEWCVQEFADFAKRVFLLNDVGDTTRADAVRGFAQLFEPGGVVAEASHAARMIWLDQDSRP